MSGNNNDWGKKGVWFGKGIIGIAIFLLLLIYVYSSNMNYLN